ncbi:MAG TPA: ATP-binding cassette domain-containing protein [Verrucomicrobiae bacterium]|nr:ATP-binding cassette domain-containing protein [Verrucomicrobiae bacterium]
MLKHLDNNHATPSTDVVEAHNLTAAYKSEVVWSNATFTIERGEFVAILGPNGAGKTTLFRLLLGLLPPVGGSLELFGTKPKRGSGLVGYVPQRRPIDSEMNIEAAELVRLGLYGKKLGYLSSTQSRRAEDLVTKALEQVDAEALGTKPLGTLSGGELQRIFLAQALVGKPQLLMLDEPFANLDIRREAQLAGLVSKIVKDQQISVLLITHDLNPLLPFLDKVIYVANGQVASGKPSEIITTKALSRLYGAPVEVLRDSKGRVAVLGTEEAIHHE